MSYGLEFRSAEGTSAQGSLSTVEWDYCVLAQALKPVFVFA
jgi:hypothetical protein